SRGITGLVAHATFCLISDWGHSILLSDSCLGNHQATKHLEKHNTILLDIERFHLRQADATELRGRDATAIPMCFRVTA
ncbi:MAG TPA: hypothetical protein VE779_14980, partial [Candidatus Angelobacter sp.]|nr:hypothetical protein [Candidatus Angelobacter sp.]